MRFSSWLGSVHSLFIRRFSGIHRKRRQETREQASVFQQVETLEQRRVLAFDFVSAYVADDAPFYVTNVTTEAVLSEAPQQIALQFTPGVEIDSSSLAGGVKIERSGGADDPFGEFGSFDDLLIDLSRGALVVDDAPSQNQVVIRFPETLPDDIYRITLSSTVTVDPTTQQEVVTGLQTVSGEAFRSGDSFSFDVRLSLGQQVAAVVPQPITRDPANFVAGLSQDRDSIEVYFNDSELLDQASAETVGFYRLIAVDEATAADIPSSEKNPASVVYDGAAHKATLAFTPGDIADDMLYRLEIGGSGIVSAPVTVAETATDHDSFATAETLGVVSQAGLLIAGSIDPRAEIDMPGDLPSLYYPTQEGTFDEPGHRVIPVDDTTHGLPEVVTSAPPAAGGFSIDLSFGEGLTPEAIEVSQLAAERWERVIVGDLTDQVHPTTGLPIDDMFITVQAGLLGSSSTHDEPGGTLANARPLDTRSPSDANPFLPFTGEIGIDMADASNPGLFDIMVHEIGHALGFTGGVFNQLDLVAGAGFIGANALREYLSLGVVAFANAVPIETDGGGGTAGSHWDEVEFGSELMTGYINETNPVSRITVGAFDDLGYVVDYSQADAYLSLLPEPLGTAGIIHTIPYNFRNDYGFDPQGNPLNNAITAEQQLRVREIFDLFSRYAGIRFVETASEGITVATGDTRAISDNSPTTSINGIASGSIENGIVTGNARAIINANRDWGESEYGGAYFREAIRQIGQVLGLWHSYDLPSVMGESLPGENVFPSDYDILHLQQLYPRAGTEIDVYSFTLADDGQFRAETFAQRQAAEASTLDTVLSVYDVGGSLISRNDDSFGRDSRVALELAAGDYYVAVSSAGNTGFNLDVTNSGLGGLSQGEYDLRLDHTPVATASTTIVDASGTPLDGDRDGKAGGAFNFHFRTAATANTIYVDKIASDALIDVSVAAANALQIELDDTTGIAPGMLVFGEGVPDGTTVASNDTATQLTLSTAVTVAVNTKLRFVTPGDGTLANPFLTISDALAAATGNTAIIRVVGNDGSELTGSSNTSGRPSLRPNALVSDVDPYHYYVGRDSQGNPLADGTNLTVPAGVTLMIDAGATLRMAAANVEVGSSSELVSRAGAALQVLGTPEKPVAFSSTLNDPETAPGSQAGQSRTPQGGDWGGLVLRADSDWQPATQASLAHDTLRPVLNSISNAVISHAGGQVVVDAELQSFAAIQIEDTRPTVAFSTVTYSAGAAVSATPNSFEESNGRVGPEFRGNTLLANSTNGVFIAIATEFGSPLDKLDVSARFASTEVTYVLQESLVIAGGSGSYYEDENGDIRARASGRLQIDPGVVVKLQSSRIELERGASQLIAEGVGNDRVIFTSLGDNRFGAGGDFDTNGNLPNKFNEEAAWTPNGTVTTGDWGGIVLNAGASASIADAYLTFGGGEVPIEGGLDDFNVIEVHQADLRLVNTRIEANASGLAQTNRNHRGTNQAATVFVLGAQPIIVGNDFRNNAGAMTSVNANSLNDLEQGDSGRQTGFVRRYEQYDDNRGPLLRGNLVSYETNLGDALAGLAVRAEEITVESVWDDTDIVHVVTDEIIVNNFHTATGLRLESDTAASLVVKLDGPNAGFTASGELLDIDDRIGGTVQVVGQPGYPVVLTSLADDSVGASVDFYGFPVTDTNLDGIATVGTAGDWRSLKFLPLANDRNVAVLNETELPYTSGQDENNVVISAEALGILPPNYATGANTWESAQEKTGDENRRQGFEVHGSIAYDDPTDVDIYTFDSYAGSEVWIDVDKTSSSLDTMVELLDASGRVLARSADSQTDTGTATGVAVQADAGGLTTVAGEQAAVVGTAAEVTAVGAEVQGEELTVTGVANRAIGYVAEIQSIAAEATQLALKDQPIITVRDAQGIAIGSVATLGGVIATNSIVVAKNGNRITLSENLDDDLAAGRWVAFSVAGDAPISSRFVVFDVPPENGVWVGAETSGNQVLATHVDPVNGEEITELQQPIAIEAFVVSTVNTQGFTGPGLGSYLAAGNATDNQNTGLVSSGGRNFYRLNASTGSVADSRSLWRTNAISVNPTEVSVSLNMRMEEWVNATGAGQTGGPVFVFQDNGPAGAVVVPEDLRDLSNADASINQLIIHLDPYDNNNGLDNTKPHVSFTFGQVSDAIDLPDGLLASQNNRWTSLEFKMVPVSGGTNISVTLAGTTIGTKFIAGYRLRSGTQFQVGNQNPAPGGGAPGLNNAFDVDDIRFQQFFNSATLVDPDVSFGLDATNLTDAGRLIFDLTDPDLDGTPVNGGAAVVTDVDGTNNVVTLSASIATNRVAFVEFDTQTAGNVEFTMPHLVVSGVPSTMPPVRLAGGTNIPFGTQVIGITGNVLELSASVTITGGGAGVGDVVSLGFNGSTVTIAEVQSLRDGMAVSGEGVPAGTFIAPGGISTPSGTGSVSFDDGTGNPVVVDVADAQFLQFGFLGAPIATNTLYLDDTSATVGATVAAASDPVTTLANVIGIDVDSSAIELDAPVTIADGDLLIFSFAGQPVTSRRVVLDATTVDDATKIANPVLVNLVGADAFNENVPDSTTVSAFDAIVGSSILELSGSATLSDRDSLGFGFAGTDLVLADIEGIEIGEVVTGPGVPAGTTVVDTTDNNPGLPPNTVVLSQAVNVEDAAALTFNVQEFSVLDAAGAAGVAVLPGSISGVLYDGNQAIQTFTSNRNGDLVFTAVGNPVSRATSGSIDYATGGISLTFNTPPRRAIELRDVAFEYSSLALETLGFAPNASTGTWENGAFPLTKDAWRGGDYYTTNPRDAGMRVTLPGTQGSQHKYFIRVRSQPAAGADATSHEANLVNEGLLNAGQTSGSYELRVRTRQRDDKPGSTVQYADIRYPQIGIDVLGLPNNSPLVGTTGEHPNDNNNTRGNAQQVGNLLTSDRNTISIAGAISDEADVDWYQFSLTYEDIQSLTLHNNSTKTWATVFDIDYADGFRGDLTLSVFDSSGALIYVGRDSNITDDQPGPGQGNDFDDLSRGSLGVLDPFIGSVQLPAGSTTPMTYYVAVSSNERLPSALDQTFESAASDPLARLEPVTSVKRVVEDHIGSFGFQSGDYPNEQWVSAGGIINAQDLSANVREFTLADVTLYVTTGGSLYTYNPMTGDRLATVANGAYGGGSVGDIDIRTDGRLFQYFGNANDNGNVGLLREIDGGTGAIISSAGDGVSNDPDTPTNWQITGSTVDALAIRRMGATGNVPHYGTSNGNSGVYYSIRDGIDSVLYWARPNGNAAFVQNEPNGRRGVITGAGVVGNTTGLQFLQDTGTLYGVSDGGQFYEVNPGTGQATNVVDFSALIQGEGGFQGLAAGPVNLYEGALRDTLFAITGSGKLVCIDPTGASDGSAALIDNLFDTTQFIDTDGNGVADTFRKDGIGDSYLSEATIGGARGLAFSPLDINLWHDTGRRAGDLGHGILGSGQTPPDNSRNVGWIRPSHAGSSMYFGLEQWSSNGPTSQFGVAGGGSYNWLQDLTAGGRGGNYDLPGGAYGSLITNSFSLAGSEYADKPTLYFNYHLETEDFDPLNPGIRDSARAFASVDGGLTWILLATNNSVDNIIPGYERPLHLSVSSRIGTAEHQRVQELFDNTGTWRQARVDLGEFAGESNIQLRFDFATAGEMETTDISNATPDAKRVVDGNGGVLTATSVVPLDSVAGLEVGMIVRSHAGTTIDGGRVGPLDPAVDVIDTTISSIDVANNTITLAAPVSTLAVGDELSFFKELPLKNNILSIARSAGDNSNGNNARGLNNAFEGFYIDDIIVGFAERGEMITSSSSNLTTFYDIGTPIMTQYPEQTLEGAYQLEIRRGTEYGSTPVQTTTGEAFADREISIHRTYDTNDRLVATSPTPVLVLAENRLQQIDGVELVPHGNGSVRATGSVVVLDDDGSAAVGTTTNGMLAWQVELAGQTAAFLNYTVSLGDAKTVKSLPDTFVYNAWDGSVAPNEVIGLPAGDGVAVSTDGGVTWKTIDNFGAAGGRESYFWQAGEPTSFSRVVDLTGEVGPLNDSTIIGFFRSGEVLVYGDAAVQITSLAVTAAPLAKTTGTIGDSNNVHEFEQGQFVVQNNIITGAASYGVRIDAGRDTATDPDGNYTGTTNAPHLGVPRNTPVLNNSGLVPGVVVANNVISGSADTGLVYAGSAGGDQLPKSAAPFGRIFNNTIVGAPDGEATGVAITDGASPTLLNNVFAELGTGVLVEGSGAQQAVISTSAFYRVGTEVIGVSQTQGLSLTDDPFVNTAAGNFYPSANTPIVDSSLNSLQDRNGYAVFKEPLGIAASPIVTPARDVFGQVRADDPDQASAPGLGLNVFKDRGAIERIDRSPPTARLIGPLDQATQAPLDDKDASVDSVRLEGREARGVQQFVIQLEDIGAGIDRASVVKDSITVLRDDVPLVEGIDYIFQFNANTNQIILASTVVFELGDYVVELRPDVADRQLVDLAGNQLLANANEGGEFYTSFAISLADVPTAPTGVKAMAADGVAQLEWNVPNTSLSTPVVRYDIEYSLDDGQNWQGWSPAGGGDVTASPVEVPWPNNEARLYRVRGVNNVGTGLGVWSVEVSATASQPLNVVGTPGLEEVSLTWTAPVNNGGQAITSYVIDRRLAEETSEDRVWTRVAQQPSTTGVTVTGLEKGIAQEFRVAARTAAGQGDWAVVSGAVTPEGTPDAPTGLAASFDPVDGSVVLNWTAPDYDGGQSITGYVVLVSDGTGLPNPQDIPSTQTQFDTDSLLQPLSRGTTYTFSVRAKNSHGEGEISAAIDQETADVPQTAPIITSVTPGESSVSLSWSAVPDGLLPVTDYVIQQSLDEGATWTTVTDPEDIATSSTVTGLSRTDGPHIFRVAAKNAISVANESDELTWSDPTSEVTPVALATAVGNLQGVAGNAQVVLTWTAPADDGGATISDYQVEVNDGAGWQVYADGTSASVGATVTGLTNGTSYDFRVAAITSAGTGTTSETGSHMPFGLPTVVQNFTATPAVGEVTLAWSVPASDGGRSIDSYRVEYATSSSGPWTEFTGDADNSDLAATVTGLTKQTQYFFRVAAQNSEGTGPSSTVEQAIPTGVPDAPTALTFTPDQIDGSLLLGWTAPVNTGALPIVGYQVQYKLSSSAAWIDLVEANNADTIADIANLDRGAAYEIRVRAENAVGLGGWLSSNVVTPDVPAAPTGLTAAAVVDQIGAIRLSWTAPAVVNGDLAITDYVIQQSLNGGISWATLPDGVGVATTYDVTGLSRAAGAHVFRVAAKNVLPGVLENDLQFTQASTPVQPLGLSEAVRLLQANEGDEQILLTWSVPSDTGGVAITDYLVEYQTNDGTGWQTFSDSVPASTGATITGLDNGVSYDLRVTPQTSLGDGVAASILSVVPYGLPAAPSAPTLVGGVGAITATWSSVSDNGRQITDYVVQYATSPSGGWTTFIDGVSSSRSATLTGVPTGVNLYVRVAAVNEAGTGAFSIGGGPAVATAVPDAPVSLVTQVNSDGTIGLSWAAPANDGGSAITDYVVQYRRTVSSTWSTYSDGVSTSRAATVSGLARASGPYVFRVLAKNAVGTGAASATSSAATPLAVPGIVGSLTATAGNEQIDVGWLSPSDNGGTSVTDYIVEYKASTAGSWTMLNDGVGVGTTATITGLTNGINYQVRVRAQNSVGDGSAVISNLAMPVTAPAAPTALSVSVDSGRASLTWTAPSGGGLVVTDYIVQYRLASTSSWSTWNDGVSAVASATLTGLTDGASYVFRVAAKTSFATGDYTTSNSQVVGPKAVAPSVVIAQRASDGLLVTWNPVLAASGIAVLGYQIEYYDSSQLAWVEAGTAVASTNNFTISGSNLARGRSYIVRVAAITSVGAGNFNTSNAVTY